MSCGLRGDPRKFTVTLTGFLGVRSVSWRTSRRSEHRPRAPPSCADAPCHVGCGRVEDLLQGLAMRLPASRTNALGWAWCCSATHPPSTNDENTAREAVPH